MSFCGSRGPYPWSPRECEKTHLGQQQLWVSHPVSRAPHRWGGGHRGVLPPEQLLCSGHLLSPGVGTRGECCSPCILSWGSPLPACSPLGGQRAPGAHKPQGKGVRAAALLVLGQAVAARGFLPVKFSELLVFKPLWHRCLAVEGDTEWAPCFLLSPFNAF